MIVGLGNVSEYEWTPHNAGLLAMDGLAERGGIRVTRPEGKSLVGLGAIVGEDVILAKPQTMMNLSGVAVRILLDQYECKPSEMSCWSMRWICPGACCGFANGPQRTHNGLKSMIRTIGTEEFIRVRIGVGPERIWGD